MWIGKVFQAEWSLQISLSKKREAEIKSCFDCNLKLHYPKNVSEISSLLEEFKLQTGKKVDYNTTFTYGENLKTDCVIVTGNVSGLADKSNAFASFLTIARKFKFKLVL